MRAEYTDVSEVINLFNNISWRIIANNKIVDADESNWITEEKYSESIIKVIAQAVADCVTDKNEFANKSASDVIIFNVKAETYSYENWNAVVLWNYLHVLKWGYLNNITRSKDKIFEDVRKRIRDHYPIEGVKELDKTLNKAISDIKEYDEALSLSEEMVKFCQYYAEMDKNEYNKHKYITPIIYYNSSAPWRAFEEGAKTGKYAYQEYTSHIGNPDTNGEFTLHIRDKGTIYTYGLEFSIGLYDTDRFTILYYAHGKKKNGKLELIKGGHLLKSEEATNAYDQIKYIFDGIITERNIRKFDAVDVGCTMF